MWLAVDSVMRQLWEIDPTDTDNILKFRGTFPDELGNPGGIAYGDGLLLIADFTEGRIWRLDPSRISGDQSAAFAQDLGPLFRVGAPTYQPTGIGYGNGVWLVCTENELFQINPANPETIGTVYGSKGRFRSEIRSAGGIAYGDGVWLMTDRSGDELWAINPNNAAATLRGTFPPLLTSPTGIAYGSDPVGRWLVVDSLGTQPLAGELWRINPNNPSDTSGEFGLIGNLARTLDAPAGLTFLLPLMPTAPHMVDIEAVAGVPIVRVLSAGYGGQQPLSYAVSELPQGWTFNPATRELTGSNRTVAGIAQITYTITAANGETTATTFRIIVSTNPADMPVERTGVLFVLDDTDDELWAVNPLDTSDTSGDFGRVGRMPSGLTTIVGATILDGDLLVIDRTGRELWRINPANPSDVTGDYGLIGVLPSGLLERPPQSTVSGAAILDGDLFTIDTATFTLWRVNPANPSDSSGDYGQVGRIGRNIRGGVSRFGGIANIMGQLYVAGGTATRLNSLYSVNHSDGSAILVGTFPELGSGSQQRILRPTAMTADRGDLFLIDDSGDDLWRINPANPGDTGGNYGYVGELPDGITQPFGGLFTSLEPPSLPPIDPVIGSVGQQLSHVLPQSITGNDPLFYSVEGLPAGIAFTASDRRIAGLPDTQGIHLISYSVANTKGEVDVQVFALVIIPNLNPPRFP